MFLFSVYFQFVKLSQYKVMFFFHLSSNNNISNFYVNCRKIGSKGCLLSWKHQKDPWVLLNNSICWAIIKVFPTFYWETHEHQLLIGWHWKKDLENIGCIFLFFFSSSQTTNSSWPLYLLLLWFKTLTASRSQQFVSFRDGNFNKLHCINVILPDVSAKNDKLIAGERT